MNIKKASVSLIMNSILALLEMVGEERAVRWFVNQKFVASVPFVQRNLLGKKRRYIETNLDKILPAYDKNQRQQLIIQQYQKMLLLLIESYFMDEKILQKVTVRGSENIPEDSNGVMFVSAHMGNWYIGRKKMEAMGYAPLILTRDYSSAPFNHQLVNTQHRYGEYILTSDIPAYIERLKAGRNGMIVVDLKIKKGRNGHKLDFCGQPAWTSTFTAEMALLYNKAIVPCINRRTADGFELEFLPAIDLASKDKVQITQAINDVISAEILKAPENWLLWDTNRWGP